MAKKSPSNNRPERANHRPRRRRRPRGVPKVLVAFLLIIALFFGGLMGFVVANKTNTYREQLDVAQERITELENLLTMMGFSEGVSDPDDFVFDDSDASDELGDLAGASGDNSSVLWNEDGLVSGMLESTGEPVVVAEFNGGELLSTEVIEPSNDQLATEAFGFGDAEADSAETLQTVMATLVADKISYLKAQELGLTELTAADMAALTAEMQLYYEEQKAFYRDTVNVTGMTAEEADAAVEQYLREEIGITLEALVAEEKENYWRVKLFNEVTNAEAATEEEIQAAYDALLADQKARFTAEQDEYEFAIMSGETIAYNLEGYRFVKHILLTFDDPADAIAVEDLYAQIAELNPDTDFEQITALQEELNGYYAELDAKADAIIAELNAGADFDAMVAQHGQDEGMAYEPTKSTGYTISANSLRFSTDFVEGCMMLENVGDVSVPVHTVSGVHIIKYIGDVTPGEVSIDAVRATLEAEVLADKQELSYINQEAQWITDANVKYYPERLQ